MIKRKEKQQRKLQQHFDKAFQHRLEWLSKYTHIHKNLCKDYSLLEKLLKGEIQYFLIQPYYSIKQTKQNSLFIFQRLQDYTLDEDFLLSYILDKENQRELLQRQLLLNGIVYNPESRQISFIRSPKLQDLIILPENHEFYTPQKIQEILYQIENKNYFQISQNLPIYYAKQLNIEEQKRQKLKTLLNNLADQTQDFHQKCPVQDIVDPELMPNYGYRYYHKDQQKYNLKEQNLQNQEQKLDDQLQLKIQQEDQNLIKQKQEILQEKQIPQQDSQLLNNQIQLKSDSQQDENDFKQFKDSFQGTNEYENDYQLYNEEENYEEAQKNYQLRFKKWKNRVQQIAKDEQPYQSKREQYQWIPTIFKIEDNNTVKIQGKIHNLELKHNEELYQLITEVFQAQLPLLENIFKIEPGQELQVVFKAQKYILQLGQSYSGKWHLEGKTESIKAACVYYISIDEGFEHDYVNFRPLEMGEDSWQQPVPILEQCSLVFPNKLPHKFDKLENITQQPIERLFMNFFIVDPEKPICMNVQDVEDIKQIIASKMNLNIAKYIMTFLGFEYDLDKAKKRRQDVRDNSDKESSGWGYVHYGNDGEMGFVDTFHTDKSERIKYQQFFY